MRASWLFFTGLHINEQLFMSLVSSQPPVKLFFYGGAGGGSPVLEIPALLVYAH
jgi:hypothetical protein